MKNTNIDAYFEHFIQECRKNFKFLSYLGYSESNIAFTDGEGDAYIKNSRSITIEYKKKWRIVEINYIINSLDEAEIEFLKSKNISIEHILIYVRNRRMKSAYNNYISLNKFIETKYPDTDLTEYQFREGINRLKNIETILGHLSDFMKLRMKLILLGVKWNNESYYDFR